MDNQVPQQPPIQQSTEQVIQHSSGIPKGLLIGAVIILMALIGFGGYVLGTKKSNSTNQTPSPIATGPTSQPTTIPTQDPTTNWKSYDGKDFTFKYPSNWLADTTQVYDSATMFKGGNGGLDTLYKSNLRFLEDSSTQSLDQYVNQRYGNQKGFKSTNTPIANVPANSFYNPIGEGTAGWYIAFSNGKNVVLFGPAENDITQDATLSAIISTFKFTN